jgi:hypothetical protein
MNPRKVHAPGQDTNIVDDFASEEHVLETQALELFPLEPRQATAQRTTVLDFEKPAIQPWPPANDSAHRHDGWGNSSETISINSSPGRNSRCDCGLDSGGHDRWRSGEKSAKRIGAFELSPGCPDQGISST